jgi:2-iminobutanoate/2-iminopropanoate deaminase
MHNVEAVLRSCGLGWSNIVKTTIFLADIADFAAVNEVYGSVFEGMKPPARSTIAAKELPRGARVEIDAIACL